MSSYEILNDYLAKEWIRSDLPSPDMFLATDGSYMYVVVRTERSLIFMVRIPSKKDTILRTFAIPRKYCYEDEEYYYINDTRALKVVNCKKALNKYDGFIIGTKTNSRMNTVLDLMY